MALDIIRQKRVLFLVVGIALFCICAAVRMFIVRQVFVSTVSLSLQQPGPTSGTGLAALSAASSLTKKYQGIIRSRKLAEDVEARVGLESALDLPSKDAAVELIQNSVTSDDNGTDNILYVRVTLAGPPPYLPGADPARERIRMLVARVANAYADSIRSYLELEDNDRELVLLRAADRQLDAARAKYEEATSRLANYVSERADGNSVLSSGSASSPGADSDLQALYIRRGQLEEQIAAAETKLSQSSSRVNDQLSNLAKVPTEDPLLLIARREYNDALQALQYVEVQYTGRSPKVEAAKERVRIARDRLNREVQGIRGSLTTPKIQADVELNSLRAQYAISVRQIQSAEQRHARSLRASLSLERFRNEATLALEMLKTASSQATSLRIQTGSAQSRAKVIDPARPPKATRESLAILGAAVFGTLLGLGAWLAAEYVLAARKAVAAGA